jgi:integrase
MRKTKWRRPARLKSKLGLPDLEQAKTEVLVSLRSPESQRSYQHSIEEFVLWYCSEPRLSFNKTVVTRYRIYLESRQLAPGTINVRLAAVRRLAYEAADSGLLSPELAAGIRRVKGSKKLGIRLGNWLTANEARTLWQLPDEHTLKGKRDRAILAVLLGCGLRRIFGFDQRHRDRTLDLGVSCCPIRLSQEPLQCLASGTAREFLHDYDSADTLILGINALVDPGTQSFPLENRSVRQCSTRP